MTRGEAKRVMVLLDWLLASQAASEPPVRDGDAMAAATQLHAAAKERLGTGYPPGHIGRAWPHHNKAQPTG
jgi:hypothetical protein